jgi:hypothetical protein
MGQTRGDQPLQTEAQHPAGRQRRSGKAAGATHPEEAMIHRGLTYEEYDALPGCRWSQIKRIDDSPRNYWYHLGRDTKQTDVQRMGRMIHCLVFEPDKYADQYAVCVDEKGKSIVRNPKHAKYKAWLEDNPGREAIKPAESTIADIAAQAVVQNQDVQDLMGVEWEGEVSLTWTDKETGLLCKGRIDLLTPYAFADLKVIGTTDPRQVGALVARNKWHGQLAHYYAGLRANGIRVPAFIIAAEGKGANDVAVFELERTEIEGALHAGEALRADLMRKR